MIARASKAEASTEDSPKARRRGPVVGQFYTQIIGNNRNKPDEEAA